jgi:hypothetical protein
MYEDFVAKFPPSYIQAPLDGDKFRLVESYVTSFIVIGSFLLVVKIAGKVQLGIQV